jgi:hypothetical protein
VKVLGSNIEERMADGARARAMVAAGGAGADDGGGGGGGGGAPVGEAWPAARMAACTARFAPNPFVGGAGGAGGGGAEDGDGWDRAGAEDTGGRGAATGGSGGGGAGGIAGADDAGGAGAPGKGGGGESGRLPAEGFLDEGSGGGFLPTGGGGPFNDTMDADEKGRGASLRAVLRRFAMEGWKEGPPGAGTGGRLGIAGAAPGGGFGAENDGGLGAEPAGISGSDRYEEDSGFAIEFR